MTWKCPVCGYENSDDAVFCAQCGTKKPENIQSVGQPEATQPVQQEQPLTSTVQPTPSEQTAPQQAATLDQQPAQVEQPTAQEALPTQQPSTQTETNLVQQPAQAPQQEQQANQSSPQSVQLAQSTQQVMQPITGKYYLIFIATPVAALNKSKIPLDFDVFESISIGRSPENVIVIPDPEISRRHAILSLEGGKLYIEDLNSTNGTYVYDGKLFQPVKGKQEINPGSVIKLGSNTMLKIVIE